MIKKSIDAIRTIFYYFFMALWTICFSTVAYLILPFTPKHHRHLISSKIWAIGTLKIASVCCGIQWQIQGNGHIPKTPCIIAANHQSSLETFFLQTYFSPQSIVFKKELLKVPIFGSVVKYADPIAIDRSKGQNAITQLVREGCVRLNNNLWVAIFPEGTRAAWPNLGKLTKGAAFLAHKSGKDILPMFHDSGKLSYKNSWVKKSGTINVTIGKVIESSHKKTNDIHQELETWMQSQHQDKVSLG